ncbi:MAG: hypothetical protein HYV60_09995 [Planctomycetia bacterium]|nr:hypothetical protein [Planctomycetia bacterium]
MTTTDFTSVDEMWKWIQDRSLTLFTFLIDELGFEIAKNEVSPTQYSLEYEKDDMRIGLWSEYGTRPAVFIETGGKRVFTDHLIAKHAKGLKLPVKPAVFGERTMKQDYRSILEAYAELIRTCLDVESTN